MMLLANCFNNPKQSNFGRFGIKDDRKFSVSS